MLSLAVSAVASDYYTNGSCHRVHRPEHAPSSHLARPPSAATGRGAYANEMSWREDNRRQSNGAQYLMVAGAALNQSEVEGYWQRGAA